MRVANSGRTQLYGAYSAVSAKIGDVEVKQNFFVSNHGAYPVILDQPYITASRMESKVLDDGSHYARIRSRDSKKSVQFLTVKSENERHRLQLRDGPVSTSSDDFVDFYRAHMEYGDSRVQINPEGQNSPVYILLRVDI